LLAPNREFTWIQSGERLRTLNLLFIVNTQATFPTTCWPLVRSAGSLDSEERRETLEDLAQRYWQPVYGYLRRRGMDADDAADLTQDFLARFCQKGKFCEADSERGRFRTFLLDSVKNFASDAWRLNNTQKRRPPGGWVRLEAAVLEEEFSFQQTSIPPELEFDRNWLRAILTRSMIRLRSHYLEKEGPVLSAYLCSRLSGESSAHEQNQIAGRLGLSDEAMRKKNQRARELLRKLVIEEISSTVRGPQQVQEELNSLLHAWQADAR